MRYAGTSRGTAVGVSTCNAALPAWPAQVWTTGAWATSLMSGRDLNPGQVLRSPNGRYRAIMQSDCNLVVYDGTAAIWQSKTYRVGSSCYVSMQTDGNLVLKNWSSAPLWSSKTWGYPEAWLTLQDDNNLVVYQNGPTGRRALWSSRDGRAAPEVTTPPPPACTPSTFTWCCRTDHTLTTVTGCTAVEAFSKVNDAHGKPTCGDWIAPPAGGC